MHTLNTHTRAHGEHEGFVVLIVPSCHMPWRSAEGALFWEVDVILFWNAIHKEILRRVLKNPFNVQGWVCLFKGDAFVWQSQVYVHKPFKIMRCSFRGGVQSNMFHCTRMGVPS